jgi:nitroimidazol reductase NimA-like FMN-containing flavoprotein (pyridoxamine 5'-phosphate oxidase superfamily)
VKETTLSEAERDAFLTETRVGILSYVTRSGDPFSVPIWFEWDGANALMFANENSMKVRRLERDPRARLLVARPAGEREEWVAIDGTISIKRERVFDLVERSASRYWDLTNDFHSSTLEDWRQIAESFVLLELRPSRIRSYVGG